MFAQVFEDVLQHWNQPVPGRNVSQGMAALEVMRKGRPAEYVKAVLSIMPKELLLSDSSMADLNDEQIDTLLATLRIELMDKNIAAAAIERLEAEHKRRIKVAKGEALRVPLWAVCQPEQVAAEIERVKVSRLAELRQAGETREVVWDEPLVIMTGVPRSPDFGKDWEPLRQRSPTTVTLRTTSLEHRPSSGPPRSRQSRLWPTAYECTSRRRPKTIRARSSREATRLPRTVSFASLTRIKICSAPSASSLVMTPRAARQLLRKKQGNGFDRRVEYPNLGIV